MTTKKIELQEIVALIRMKTSDPITNTSNRWILIIEIETSKSFKTANYAISTQHKMIKVAETIFRERERENTIILHFFQF